MPKPPKIPESVLVVIHTPELDVLIIERADHKGFWQSVTGSKDHVDEPLTETAAREVAEETGIVIGSELVPGHCLLDWHHSIEYSIYPEWRYRYAEGVTRNTEHQFSLLVPHCLEVTLAPREHTALCGCRFVKPPTVAFPRRIVRRSCIARALAEHNR